MPLTSSARKVGKTNIKDVSNAEEAVVEVMTLSEIHVMKNILMRMTPCPIHVSVEKGRMIEDHLGSGVGLRQMYRFIPYLISLNLPRHYISRVDIEKWYM